MNGNRPPRKPPLSPQVAEDFAAEIAIAAAALLFAAEFPERWRQFVNFAGELGGPGARETGVLTADYARGAAGRIMALATAAMKQAGGE